MYTKYFDMIRKWEKDRKFCIWDRAWMEDKEMWGKNYDGQNSIAQHWQTKNRENSNINIISSNIIEIDARAIPFDIFQSYLNDKMTQKENFFFGFGFAFVYALSFSFSVLSFCHALCVCLFAFEVEQKLMVFPNIFY